MKFLRLSLFGLALNAFPVALMAQDVFVGAAEYQCLVVNSNSYMAAAEQGIAIVILEKCPDTEVSAIDIQQLALNVDVQPRMGEGVPFVSLRQDELSCIDRGRGAFLSAPITSGTVNLTKALRDYC